MDNDNNLVTMVWYPSASIIGGASQEGKYRENVHILKDNSKAYETLLSASVDVSFHKNSKVRYLELLLHL